MSWKLTNTTNKVSAKLLKPLIAVITLIITCFAIRSNVGGLVHVQKRVRQTNTKTTWSSQHKKQNTDLPLESSTSMKESSGHTEKKSETLEKKDGLRRMSTSALECSQCGVHKRGGVTRKAA